MNQCCDINCDKPATQRIFNGMNPTDLYDYTEMCEEHGPSYTNPGDRVEPIEIGKELSGVHYNPQEVHDGPPGSQRG